MMHTTIAPISTLLEMRKNAHALAVGYRCTMSCCTVWMRLIFLARVNGVSSPSVCVSIMRLLRLARVTRETALSSAAIMSESHANNTATTTMATIAIMRSSSDIVPSNQWPS